MNFFKEGFFNRSAEVPKETDTPKEENIEQKPREEKKENPLEDKELIQSLMIKKLEGMIDVLKEKKKSERECRMIGENVLNVKINMVRNFIEDVKSGKFVDLKNVRDKVQFARDVDVRYLDDKKTIKPPEQKNKMYWSSGVGV